ncbi:MULTISPECIES: helix-turn-helix domain-containing protein [unclassified Haladaptatus]|uniref:ArsR/SmtB family transcription factor n=1 Tax=unclassified Haladaptatus TaxID=2622732 RepID=UPI00209C4144|nr:MULTISPECIES: helix-turn-helix domain-containing protein [unclassified Haladaptatus]MCO8246574.1 helix-turn-helix domain-containing protein [Haladaptatus sp. AB643]MCO8256305.1 helix-turn-helix domain-containing protein [Haladaptatus sp. AB618]
MDWLPARDVDGTQRGDPRLIGLDDENIDEALDAISSATARTLLTEIYSDPVTPSDLRDRTDNSLQTISYHLGKLENAGLVRVADTRYSDQGREMAVYAAPDDPVVLFVGTENRKNGLRDLFARVFGAGILLLGATIYVLYRTFEYSSGPPGSDPTSHGLLDISFITFFTGGFFVLVLVLCWGIWARLR